MPDDPKDALPQPASASAAGNRRRPFRSSNLTGTDEAAENAFNSGADRPADPFPASDIADPFAVKGID